MERLTIRNYDGTIALIKAGDIPKEDAEVEMSAEMADIIAKALYKLADYEDTEEACEKMAQKEAEGEK